MSVCIVHRDGWVVTDSRSTSGTGAVCPVKAIKYIKVKDHTIITAVGDAIITQRLDVDVHDKDEEDTIFESSLFMNTSPYAGCLLLVNESNELVTIDGNGTINEIEDYNFWAIGEADEYVIGYLLAIESVKGHIQPIDAHAAIKMAAKFCTGIDDRTQEVALPSWESL